MKLDTPFSALIDILISKCKERGVNLLVTCKVRDPWQQARLWRQSRNSSQVYAEVLRLKGLGAEFLASCLLDVGPQRMGPRATNAIPGLSWHQWGEAVDICPLNSAGEPDWDDSVGFQICAEEARSMGLTSGYFWEFKDAGHVQLRNRPILDFYSIAEIDHEIRKRFNGEGSGV